MSEKRASPASGHKPQSLLTLKEYKVIAQEEYWVTTTAYCQGTVDGSNRKYYIGLELQDDGETERSQTVIINDNEFDLLLLAIDELSEVSSKMSRLPQFEATYSTSGGLRLTVVGHPNGHRSFYIGVGNITRQEGMERLNELEKMLRETFIVTRNLRDNLPL